MFSYYIRIANQLLVEDDDEGEGKGFVMLTADINVRLKKSLKERGKEFLRFKMKIKCISSEYHRIVCYKQ
jgi:hypothetical protein